ADARSGRRPAGRGRTGGRGAPGSAMSARHAMSPLPPAASLLEPDEPPAFEIVNPEGRSSAVLLCDHASNLVPRRLARLGLYGEELSQHIGWDLGAARLSRRLSALLDAPLVLS